jgi:homoserine O-acetyltransferase
MRAEAMKLNRMFGVRVHGRTTREFINLKENSATHDAGPFVPFGNVITGMDVADGLNSEHGETAGGGIRGGNQGPLFQKGNAYLLDHFPRLDSIIRRNYC